MPKNTFCHCLFPTNHVIYMAEIFLNNDDLLLIPQSNTDIFNFDAKLMSMNSKKQKVRLQNPRVLKHSIFKKHRNVVRDVSKTKLSLTISACLVINMLFSNSSKILYNSVLGLGRLNL